LPQILAVEGERTSEQLVEQCAQGIDIGAGVYVEATHLGLLRAHVLGGADEDAELGEEAPLGQVLGRRLGHAEVDDLGNGAVVLDRHQDVRGLQVTVDDPLLVRVLDPLADLHEQPETLSCAEQVPVAVGGDGFALDVLHGEVRPALRRRATVEDSGDHRVVHERQSLSLGLEAGDDLGRVHSRLDDLQGHLATNGLHLLREPDLSHASFAETLEKAVASEGISGGSACLVERAPL
jgi:hypothetical protein